MALDLGTLGVRVEAQVGDTINRLNAVTDAVDGLSDAASGLSLDIDISSLEEAQNEINDVANSIKGVDLNVEGSADVDISDAESNIGSLEGLISNLDLSSLVGSKSKNIFGDLGIGSIIDKLNDKDGLLGGAISAFTGKITSLSGDLAAIAPFGVLLAGAAELVDFLWGDDIQAAIKPMVDSIRNELEMLKVEMSTGLALRIEFDEQTLEAIEARVAAAEEKMNNTVKYYDDMATFATRYGWTESQAIEFQSMAGILEIGLDDLGRTMKETMSLWQDKDKAATLKSWGISEKDSDFEQLAKIVSAARQLQDTNGGNAGFTFLESLLGGTNAQNLLPWMMGDPDYLRSVQQQMAAGGVYSSDGRFASLADIKDISEQLNMATDRLTSSYFVDEAIDYAEAQNASTTALNQMLAMAEQYGLDSAEFRVAADAYGKAREAETEARNKLVAKEAELEATITPIVEANDKLAEAEANVAEAEKIYEANPNTTNKNNLEQAEIELAKTEKAVAGVIDKWDMLDPEKVDYYTGRVNGYMGSVAPEAAASLGEFLGSGILQYLTEAEWQQILTGAGQSANYKWVEVDDYGNKYDDAKSIEDYYGSKYVDLDALLPALVEKYSGDFEGNVNNAFDEPQVDLTPVIELPQAVQQVVENITNTTSGLVDKVQSVVTTPLKGFLDVSINIGKEFFTQTAEIGG